MGILVEACGVCKSYKHGNLNTDVLRHVDMSVSAGEMVSIVGPSGSGKSTLLHCLAGLEVPDAGEIHLMGVDVVRARRGERAKVRAQHVGFVFQQYNLMPSLSVGENISLPARFAGSKLSRENVRELLERVGMGGSMPVQPSCQVARRSAWRSPGLSLPARTSCSPMNPPAPSTRRTGTWSSTYCEPWRMGRAGPSSW